MSEKINLPPDFCPYKGLEPYTEDPLDRAFFFGRDIDREIIISNLYASPLTILYGASGVGKSSVLMAGVVPKVKRVPRLAIMIFRDWQDAGFMLNLKNKLLNAVGEKIAPREVDVDPTLPFDDFLLECTRSLHGTIFIIFDQFEEYFLYQPPSLVGFDAEFARSVNRREVDTHFLLAMREDGLSKLDRFQGRIPNLLSNMLRLEHLDRIGAVDAIRKPVLKYNDNLPVGQTPIVVEDKLVGEVIKQVKVGQITIGGGGQGQLGATTRNENLEERIETPFLQMVLTRLWEKEMEKGSRILQLDTLTNKEKLGGAQKIVRTHLDKVMEKLNESERDITARLFRFLVTPTGTKIAHTLRDLASYAEKTEEQVQPILNLLISPYVRILRPIAPPPDQPVGTRYEIFHDVLAPAILDWRARYVQAQERAEADKQRKEAEKQARAEEQAKVAGLLRWLSIALAGALILAVLAGFFSYKKGQESRSRELALNARNLLEADPRLSFRLVEKALDYSLTPEAKEVLRETLKYRFYFELRGNELAIERAEVSPKGKQILTKSRDGKIRLWDSATGRGITTLETESGIGIVKFFPHDERVLSTSNDGTVTIWDGRTGKLLRRVEQVRNVASLEFSPDGEQIVSVSGDGKVRVWKSDRGGLIHILPHKREELRKIIPEYEFFASDEEGEVEITEAKFSPDGKRIVTTSSDGTVSIFDIVKDKKLNLPVGQLDILSVRFSSDGKQILIVFSDITLQIWNVVTKEVVNVLKYTGEIIKAAYTPDDKRVITLSDDGKLRIYDTATGNKLDTLGYGLGIWSVEFFPDDKRILTLSRDGIARVWHLYTFKELNTLTGHESVVNSAELSPNGKHIVTASNDGIVKIWDGKLRKELYSLVHDSDVKSATFSSNGELISTVSWDGMVRIWKSETGQLLHSLKHEREVVSAEFSPDGERIITASGDGSAIIWDSRTGKMLKHLRHKVGLLWTEFSRDGKRILTLCWDRTVRIWNRDTGELLHTLQQERTVLTARFNPDPIDYRIVSGSDDGTVIVWDINKVGEPTRVLKGHTRAVNDARFSPDGKRVVTASSDGTVRIWEFSAWKEDRILEGHTNEVTTAEFSPDGKYIVSASKDGKAIVWDVSTGKSLQVLTGHGSEVLTAKFSPDSNLIVTASRDNTAQIWISNFDYKQIVKSVNEDKILGAVADLTEEERKRYHLMSIISF